MMRKCTILIVAGWLVTGSLISQQINRFSLNPAGEAVNRPSGNFINEILVTPDGVWIGSSDLDLTRDGGDTFTRFDERHGIGRGGVAAMAWRDGELWISTAFDSLTKAGVLDTGGGLSYTRDGGDTWNWVPQPQDSLADTTRYAPTATPVQNVTWDIALTEDAVWTASWAGGMRRSYDMGETWEVITVDDQPFDVSDANDNALQHMAFSLAYDDGALYMGSAGGIHKSTDGGETWTTFTHQNQASPISGNFVVALAIQRVDDRSVVWAATWEALDETEFRAVSKSEDGGLTWEVVLAGETVHNIGFNGHEVYACADNGLFKSDDGGETWTRYGTIEDPVSGERINTSQFNTAQVENGYRLWAGTRDGLAKTEDNGLSWRIFRAFQMPGEDGTPESYAYPNPFSHTRHNQWQGDGFVRFQYHLDGPARVTVKVYDFGMNLVKTVASDKARAAAGDYSEIWNARNDLGEIVANGAYFYKLEVEGRDDFWGKVLIVD